MDNINIEVTTLKNIAEIMKQYGLNHVKIENENLKYELKREICLEENILSVESHSPAEQKIMKSPLVGIFYRRKSPESKPFVEVGDKVKKGDTICLIEAMKTFTEVISDFEGQIIEICAEDGDIIEFSQPLFKYVS